MADVVEFGKNKLMQEQANNVVLFPSKNRQIPGSPKTIEEITANMDMIKHMHIQETIETIAPKLFEQIAVAGFALSDDSDDELEIKIGAFIVEAIRSLLSKNYDLHHPFQDIADNIFLYDDEEGLLTINKKFSIIIKNENADN